MEVGHSTHLKSRARQAGRSRQPVTAPASLPACLCILTEATGWRLMRSLSASMRIRTGSDCSRRIVGSSRSSAWTWEGMWRRAGERGSATERERQGRQPD